VFRADCKASEDKGSLIPFSEQLAIYRSLYLAHILINRVYADYVTSIHMGLDVNFMILALYVTMRHYDDLPFHLYIVWPTLFATLTVFAIACYNTSGMVFIMSSKFKRSMAGQSKLTLLERAQVTMLRPMALQIGNFFYVNMKTAFLFLFCVVENAIGLLLFADTG